ncbi:hypothetical protein H5P28_00875 [Ruficoccus amylovorans]|uniref:Uncharacterized protein n=1 Tax=Ruficoccus amylovorans TaxID=1804625 RepID=A0A842HB46_9BACT|nr:hypothetical protein [Ruficoccus amylovorans]MBC2592804.1 hypothetical protein [Ruficoccus amylovorans]
MPLYLQEALTNVFCHICRPPSQIYFCNSYQDFCAKRLEAGCKSPHPDDDTYGMCVLFYDEESGETGVDMFIRMDLDIDGFRKSKQRIKLAQKGFKDSLWTPERVFEFIFLHELGHVVLKHMKTTSMSENEADAWALNQMKERGWL